MFTAILTRFIGWTAISTPKSTRFIGGTGRNGCGGVISDGMTAGANGVRPLRFNNNGFYDNLFSISFTLLKERLYENLWSVVI